MRRRCGRRPVSRWPRWRSGAGVIGRASGSAPSATLLHSTALAGAALTLTAVLLAALIASGVALQAVLGALLTRRFLQGAEPLEKERDALAFLALGGPLACLVSASAGVAGLYFLGAMPASALAVNWLTWWAGDSLGVLLFAPLTLLILPHRQRPQGRSAALH